MTDTSEYRRHDTAADRLPSAVRNRLDKAIRRQVFVFDSDPRALKVYRKLGARGWEVRTFDGFATAVPALIEQTPVAVIAGLGTGDLDAIAMLAEVARLRTHVRRVLAVSDGNEDDIVRAINEAAVYRIAEKPLTVDGLLEILEGAFALRRRELAVEFLVDDVRTQNERLSRARGALERREAHLVHTERLAVLGRLTDGLATGLKPLLGRLRVVATEIRGLASDPDDQELLSMGNDAVDAVWDIIHDINRYTVHGGISIHRQPTDLVDLVERSVRFAKLDHRLTRRQVSVYTEPVPPVSVDGRKIRQVLLNLLRNAAEATPEGARITVRIAPTTDHVIVIVTDEGSGMPAGVIDHVFEEFFSTKGTDGLGLGLAMARSIVEEHGGSIACSSRLGAGTTFTIRLPLTDPGSK